MAAALAARCARVFPLLAALDEGCLTGLLSESEAFLTEREGELRGFVLTRAHGDAGGRQVRSVQVVAPEEEVRGALIDHASALDDPPMLVRTVRAEGRSPELRARGFEVCREVLVLSLRVGAEWAMPATPPPGLRWANEGDVAALEALERAAHHQAFDAALGPAPRGETLLIEDSEGLAGSIELGAGAVLSLQVAERARGRGLGRSLLEAGLRALAAHGYRHVEICADLDNEVARALYDALGFAPERVDWTWERAAAR